MIPSFPSPTNISTPSFQACAARPIVAENPPSILQDIGQDIEQLFGIVTTKPPSCASTNYFGPNVQCCVSVPSNAVNYP